MRELFRSSQCHRWEFDFVEVDDSLGVVVIEYNSLDLFTLDFVCMNLI